MSESGDPNGPSDRKTPTVQLDPLNLVERIGCHVALTAVRAVSDRNILDQQEILPFAVCPGDLSNPRPFLAAVITRHRFTRSPRNVSPDRGSRIGHIE